MGPVPVQMWCHWSMGYVTTTNASAGAPAACARRTLRAPRWTLLHTCRGKHVLPCCIVAHCVASWCAELQHALRHDEPIPGDGTKGVGRAQSRCRCGGWCPVPGADGAAASPVPVQMWDSPIGRNSSEFFAETNSNLSFESGLHMALTGGSSPGADVGRGEPKSRCRSGRGEPSLCADAAAVRPVQEQICKPC